MRVFISSVRRELEEERDSLPGLITAIGHEPLRFEDFTAQVVPSREACVKGVKASDAYLLLLGPIYGDVFPETGQSPTHDEYATAKAMGIPRIVMRKTGVKFEPAQEEFAKLVTNYSTGLFSGRFTGAVDLQAKVAAVLRDLASKPGHLEYSTLDRPVDITWRGDWDTQLTRNSAATACLEVHVRPVAAVRQPARLMTSLQDRIITAVRSQPGISATAGLTPTFTEAQLLIEVAPDQRRRNGEVSLSALAGIRYAQDGQFSAWSNLPHNGMGSIIDPQDVTKQVAAALRLAGTLGVFTTGPLVAAAGVEPLSMVAEGTVSRVPVNTMSGFEMSRQFLRVEPDEGVSLEALDLGAAEVANALAGRVVGAFRAPRE